MPGRPGRRGPASTCWPAETQAAPTARGGSRPITAVATGPTARRTRAVSGPCPDVELTALPGTVRMLPRRGPCAIGTRRRMSCWAIQTYVITYAARWSDHQQPPASAKRSPPARRRGRPADQGPARGDGALAARPGRAHRRQRADAVAGRARRDQPDPGGRRQDRRRAGADPVAAAAARRGPARRRQPRQRPPPLRARRPPLRGADAAAARPARRRLPARAEARAPPPAAAPTRRCTSPAAARPPSSWPARWR